MSKWPRVIEHRQEFHKRTKLPIGNHDGGGFQKLAVLLSVAFRAFCGFFPPCGGCVCGPPVAKGFCVVPLSLYWSMPMPANRPLS